MNDGRRQVINEIARRERRRDPPPWKQIVEALYAFSPKIAHWCVIYSASEFVDLIPREQRPEFDGLIAKSKEYLLSGLPKVEVSRQLIRASLVYQAILKLKPADDDAESAGTIIIHAARAISSPSTIQQTPTLRTTIEFFDKLVLYFRLSERKVVDLLSEGIESYPDEWISETGQQFSFARPAPAPAPPLKAMDPSEVRSGEEAKPQQKPSRDQQKIAKKAFCEKLFPIEEYIDEKGKRRYKRIDPAPAGIPLSIPPRKDYYLLRRAGNELRNGSVFGLLVNPRSGELLLAAFVGGYCNIRLPDGLMAGSGHFDPIERYSVSGFPFSTMATGYPRVHTPEGVQVEGGGFGTVLYSALCLASHINWIGGPVSPQLPLNGIYDGISSMPDWRSASAEAWWSAAKMRFDLAYEVMATNTVTGVSKPCDVYEYSALLASNMVIAWSPNGPSIEGIERAPAMQFMYDAKGDGKSMTPANRKAVVNVNVSNLSNRVFSLLSDLASQSGATQKELDGMEHRFRTKTHIVWKNPGKGYRASLCRKTAASSGLSWAASGQTREGLMRAAEMPEEYERLAQETLDLGWPFMAD